MEGPRSAGGVARAAASSALVLARAARACAALCLSVAALSARASSDPLTGLLAAPGGAGLGVATRFESSPYRGGGTRHDLVPLYLYDGKRVYLHAYRFGLKLVDRPEERIEAFLAHRFEGFPYDRIPPSLAGMTARQPELDFGPGYEHRGGWGALWAEWLHDATNTSDGDELRLGYNYAWRNGRVLVRPQFMLALRSGRLNDYYYGMRGDEATATRPAYRPGSGVNAQVALYASYFRGAIGCARAWASARGCPTRSAFPTWIRAST